MWGYYLIITWQRRRRRKIGLSEGKWLTYSLSLTLYLSPANVLFSHPQSSGCFRLLPNIIFLLLLILRVFVPLSSKKLANECKLAFCAAGELSDSSDSVGLTFRQRQRLRQRLRRRREREDVLVEQSDNLAEAGPHVWVLHPTRLHYEGQTRRYTIWQSGPLLLHCFKTTTKLRLDFWKELILLIHIRSERKDLESCSIGGLEVGHALKWHPVSKKLP